MSEELIKNIREQIHVTEKYRQLKALMLALVDRSQPTNEAQIAERVETVRQFADVLDQLHTPEARDNPPKDAA